MVLVAVTAAAWAGGDLTHRVAPGESASSIAARYYGDHDVVELLLGYNGKPGMVIRAGESLKIPVCDEHVVRVGDSGSALAQRYLGRADGWPTVALLNGLLPERPLHVGQRLVFPVVFDHALRPGESLAGLAQRFYGDPERSDILTGFNAVDDPRRLSVGQTVEIPLVVFRALEEPEAGSNSMPEPQEVAAAPSVPAPQPERFSSELRSVELALAEGQFAAAADQIGRLLDEVTRAGSATEQVELWRLSAVVAVAEEDEERACQAYQALIDVQPDWAPDPELASPKVRDAFARCI
jgi:LysM repeat protein